MIKRENINFFEMQNKTLRTATILALGTAIISGASNFLNKFAVAGFTDPVAFTALKNLIVAGFLLGLLVVYKKRQEIRGLTKQQWLRLILIGVVGGSVPFALFFIGLAQIPAINAALIHKTLFVWVLLFALPFLKEKFSALQWLGVAAIFSANILVGGFRGFAFSAGEGLVLLATILWAAENIIAKIALRDLSALTVASGRMVFGSLILLPLALVRVGSSALLPASLTQWTWVVLTGLFLLGYTLTWYAALKRAPVSYVATLLVPATLVTNALSALFVTHSFNWQLLSSFELFVAGTFLLIYFARNLTRPAAALSELGEGRAR